MGCHTQHSARQGKLPIPPASIYFLYSRYHCLSFVFTVSFPLVRVFHEGEVFVLLTAGSPVLDQ